MRKLAFCFTLCLLTCLRAVAQDRSTPEATVRSFLSAFTKGDVKLAAGCVKGVQLGDAGLEALAQQIRKEPVTFSLSSVNATLNGANARLTGQVGLKSNKQEKVESFSTDVNLTQVGGNWLIVPDASKVQDNRAPDMVNALAYVLTDAKTFTRARDAARSSYCLSNVKQMSTGAMMLSQDNDETFKLKADSYKKSLMPYIKSEAVFKCPADPSGGVSYSFNSALAGLNYAKIKSPAETVMIYEGKNGKLEFRHDGRAAVGFADGHAKMVNAEGAKKLRWKP